MSMKKTLMKKATKPALLRKLLSLFQKTRKINHLEYPVRVDVVAHTRFDCFSLDIGPVWSRIDKQHLWDQRWMGLAKFIANWSEDTSTKVGCVIVDPRRQDIVALGWNGLPRKVKNTSERNTRPEKYLWYEHAERNALYNAAASSSSPLSGCTLYVSYHPCVDCMRGIIQCGISRIVTLENTVQRTGDNFTKQAKEMAKEAGIIIDVI